MARINIITTEPLPLPGWPATGAGLRAWGLAQGLRSRGHQVQIFMPEKAAEGFAPPAGHAPPTQDFPEGIQTFFRPKAKEDMRIQDCDVLVLQHWGIARDLGELHVPMALDLAGPHLLERKFWGSPDSEADLFEKLDALRKADFLTASGEMQRLYFLPYLAMAGWDISVPSALPVIPFSLKADAAIAPVRTDRFLYGGFFLPWQDPSRAIGALLDEMDLLNCGELVFIGGAHPRSDVSRGKFEPLLARLRAHSRVKMFDPMSYDAYTALLREGGIALDLMGRNAERELAFTTRTVQYMACGLPAIHDNYSELGDLIADSKAGWSVDPEDDSAFRELVRGLLSGIIDPAEHSANAFRLVGEKLDWDKTINPLADFCASPYLRETKTRDRLAFEGKISRLAKLEAELRETTTELRTIRGRRWVRWGEDIASGRGIFRWALAVCAQIAGLLMISIFWISDHSRRD